MYNCIIVSMLGLFGYFVFYTLVKHYYRMQSDPAYRKRVREGQERAWEWEDQQGAIGAIYGEDDE